MDLLVNDLSLAGQFPDVAAFREAVGRLMTMRLAIRRHGRELYCHRKFVLARATPSLTAQQAVARLPVDEQRALMPWLSKFGPFWDDEPRHGPSDYLTHKDDIVTDTALGEAAFCSIHGVDRRLVSFIPSVWEFSPIEVSWYVSSSEVTRAAVENYCEIGLLVAALAAAPAEILSWDELAQACESRFTRLTILEKCFEPLRGFPFSPAAAGRITALLGVLDELKGCFDDGGRRTPKGQWLVEQYFTGDNAWFSDSSDTEKHSFRSQMSFPSPSEGATDLFCSWHGKVRSGTLRVHFSWPVSATEPLYVVYAGPKITKH